MSLQEMLKKAIMQELYSQRLYEQLMSEVENPIFMDRLAFILAEEEWQEDILRALYKERFGELENIDIEYEEKQLGLRELIDFAMEEEIESREHYIALFEQVDEKDIELRKLFYYFVRMELTHYQILEAEQECIERFPDSAMYWSKEVEKEVKE